MKCLAKTSRSVFMKSTSGISPLFPYPWWFCHRITLCKMCRAAETSADSEFQWAALHQLAQRLCDTKRSFISPSSCSWVTVSLIQFCDIQHPTFPHVILTGLVGQRAFSLVDGWSNFSHFGSFLEYAIRYGTRVPYRLMSKNWDSFQSRVECEEDCWGRKRPTSEAIKEFSVHEGRNQSPRRPSTADWLPLSFSSYHHRLDLSANPIVLASRQPGPFV